MTTDYLTFLPLNTAIGAVSPPAGRFPPQPFKTSFFWACSVPLKRRPRLALGEVAKLLPLQRFGLPDPADVL